MWFVVVPASRLMTQDESERTQIVGKIAKEFGRIVNPTLVILILTGIYNATWYVPSVSSLVSYPGTILLTKMILVAVLIIPSLLEQCLFRETNSSTWKRKKVRRAEGDKKNE